MHSLHTAFRSSGSCRSNTHRYSVYLLYWYYSANSDAARGITDGRSRAGARLFTGTRVQILTLQAASQTAVRALVPVCVYVPSLRDKVLS
jgi:hypothetical protein